MIVRLEDAMDSIDTLDMVDATVRDLNNSCTFRVHELLLEWAKDPERRFHVVEVQRALGEATTNNVSAVLTRFTKTGVIKAVGKVPHPKGRTSIGRMAKRIYSYEIVDPTLDLVVRQRRPAYSTKNRAPGYEGSSIRDLPLFPPMCDEVREVVDAGKVEFKPELPPTVPFLRSVEKPLPRQKTLVEQALEFALAVEREMQNPDLSRVSVAALESELASRREKANV
jgi:hypothetical protein